MITRPEIHVCIDVSPYEAAKYAFQVLLADAEGLLVFHRGSRRNLPPDAIRITYGRDFETPAAGRGLLLRASGRFWDHYGQEASLPARPLTRLALAQLGVGATPRLRSPLVFPYVSEDVPPSIDVQRAANSGAGIWIATGADVIASAFFWITRYQESLIRERDEEGRIPQALLVEVQEGLTERPLVDEYAELLRIWIGMLESGGVFRESPFRVLLTHDVDTGIGVRGFWRNAENGVRTLYREVVRSRRPATGLRGFGAWTLKALGARKEPSLFLDIVREDRELGFPSVFFLMANGTHPKDATYDVLGTAARDVIAAIQGAGGEVGLHVGLNAHRRAAQLRMEWERLRQAAPEAWPASRSHFLAFFPPATWRQLLDLGFRVDSTLGYSHHLGFRGGTCRGFRPFDVERLEVLPIWELPMTVMDVNLFSENAGDALRVARVREIANRVRAHGGCLVVNWHNVSFIGHYREVYREALRDSRGAKAVRLADIPTENKDVVLW